jgi:hypothetical protein
VKKLPPFKSVHNIRENHIVAKNATDPSDPSDTAGASETTKNKDDAITEKINITHEEQGKNDKTKTILTSVKKDKIDLEVLAEGRFSFLNEDNMNLLLKFFQLNQFNQNGKLFSIPSDLLPYESEELADIEEEENIKDLSQQVKNDLASAVEIYEYLLLTRAQPRLNLSDFLEPDSYTQLYECSSWDSGYSFKFHAPDIDIGLSPILMTTLGFSRDFSKRSIKDFEKRRFFQAYLENVANNDSFLQGKGFKFFRDRFLIEFNNLTKLPESSSSLWQFMVHIITRLFKIDAIQVWNDFNGYLNTKESNQIASNDTWPKNTPWSAYFDNKSFYALIEYIWKEDFDDTVVSRNKTFSRNKFNSDSVVFRKRGILLAFYMLKTLCEEYPNADNILKTDIQPALLYSNSTFFIYTDIIEPNYVNEDRARLLIQTINNSKKKSQDGFVRQTFNPIQYKQCAAGIINLSTIHVFIYSLLGKEVAFQRGPREL